MRRTLSQIQGKMGKWFTPTVLVIFSLFLFLIMFTSVRQKSINIQVGQLAEETLRANKTIENTHETEQKKQLAAEAVTPEYNYQEDLGATQHERIQNLFTMIGEVNKKADADYQAAKDKAKKDQTVPEPTVEEKVAALKSRFESLNQDDIAFYQALPNAFYESIFAMNDADVSKVETESLKLVDGAMSEHVRSTNLDQLKQNANDKIQYLDASSNMQQAIRYLINQGIVVNDVYNEKRTEELKQQARDNVQPAMIYQGEIIVREGVQIDQKAMEKLELLGMTNQNSSFFPIVALILAILLQVFVLLYLIRQMSDVEQRYLLLVFYTVAMGLSLLLMKFFQIFQTEQMTFIPLFYPAAFTPLVLSIFINRRAGILGAVFQVLFAIFVYYDSVGTNFLTVVLVAYLFAGTMASMLKRQRIGDQGIQALVWVVVIPTLVNIVLVIYQGMSLTEGRTWTTLACAVAGSVLSYLLTMGLHPYIELLVTDDSMIVLNELSNPNHPLLKQLLEEAPGTYHHSMMVASLSANAVAEIGGRSLLTRVACYYHDIGKIKHANFFVENLPAGAENPHNFLLPEDSKQIIFGHVIDGAKILEEYHMPQMVVDICRQHHGTTLMKYFFVKAQERNPEVTEEEFRYPGPKPQTREAGIVNIADSCEAAVRAMDHPTNEKIQKFVHNLIAGRIKDGQLDECGLTMKEIRIVERSIINGLCSTFHSRIKYPKMKSEAEKMKEEQEKSED
ncbi:metal-dependent phosphohydrolase domain protein [Enterococcus canis]|uniref:Metal-dependent phosphohydrolase domain protein n=1 Tax=Enterococcus canis TaxID=214095 RepID=A0A1L8RJY7_9ENTE|nr:HDIG domain-containing metalloprotein [Enterococcus canis]OJG20012.1 metal-dependent phosphohydrolase domain protein [Enterococcus canis]